MTFELNLKFNSMKSFLRFIVIALLPILIISIFSILRNGNFEDFKSNKVIFFSIFFFSIISFSYVYVFKIYLHNVKSSINKLIITSIIVFLFVFIFGLIFPSFQFETIKLLTALFQGTLAVCVFLLEYLILNFYSNFGNKNELQFIDKPTFYIKMLILISFFESLLFCVMTLDVYIQNPTLATFLSYFYPMLAIPLLINVVAFISLKYFSRLKILKYNVFFFILLSIFTSFLVVNVFNMIRFKYVFHANVFYIILCLFSTLLIYTIVNYRYKLSASYANLRLSKNDTFKKNAEYLQLKQQVNPHFLFNNLNTLISFIELNPKKAIEFGQNLSNTYRHYLKNQEEDFVLLSDETTFIKEYLEIYKAKFENGFEFDIDVESSNNKYILSLALQEIIDNIFKHNILDEKNPLKIKVYISIDMLYVSNSMLSRNSISSTNIGLENINNRYQLLTQRKIEVSQIESDFQVALPILQLE